MKFELLIFGMTAFFVANTYYDGKYVLIMKSWKKYYQMAGIAFIGLSFYLFLKKYPSHTQSLFKHANGMIKYMPIDKDAGDLLKPLSIDHEAGTRHRRHFPRFPRCRELAVEAVE